MTRKKSRLEIEETEAKTLHLIYELYASGLGYKAIVNRLNKGGYQTKRKNAFSVAQLRTILTNPVYIGKVRFDVRRNWNEKRRRLLHMLISEITIDKDRNIDSIKLKLTDELVRFLQNNDGTPPDGAPSVFLFR